MTRDEMNQVSEKIIGLAYKVHNTLGAGFLEKVYENALAHELRKAGIKVAQQQKIDVIYDGIVVGVYITDLLVEECINVEIKTVKAIDDVHLAVSLNYLRATKLSLSLILNFAKPRVEIKRVVHNF
ncbi:MAG: GxxExxY protein [Planctomycetes bacterium]|nr:GxxExxY protein [Planctomycetota bacterium]